MTIPIAELTRKFDVDDIIAFDSEYAVRRGWHVRPLCLGAKSMVTGQTWFEWHVPGEGKPAFLNFEDDRILWVTYAAAAEWSYCLAAGYASPTSLPCNIVDLYAEDRLRINGRLNSTGKKATANLIHALHRAEIQDPYADSKERLQRLIGGCPDFSLFTESQRAEIRTYQMHDVEMHAALFLEFAKDMPSVAQVLNRGDFSRVVANYEWNGIPVDVEMVERMMAARPKLQNTVIEQMERKYAFGVYEFDAGDRRWHWSHQRFAQLVRSRGLETTWPETSNGSGIFCVADPKRGSEQDKIFKRMCAIDPFFEPLRQGKHLVEELRSFQLPIGPDSRVRATNLSFAQKGMRSSPQGGSIFAMDSRNRMLILLPEGISGVYSDLSSCEFVVAAVKSRDPRMLKMCDDVRDGRAESIYLEIMKVAGVARPDATKSSVGSDYKVWKTGCLATIYGQSAEGLRASLNVPFATARFIYDFVHSYFGQFWRYIRYEIVRGESRGFMETRGGWRLDTRHQKRTTLQNFPIQAEAAEILHLGTVKMVDSGVQIATTVHDAVLALDTTEQIEETAQLIAECWAEAGMEVIGYPIFTDPYVFSGRFNDKDGMPGWDRLLSLLEECEQPDPDVAESLKSRGATSLMMT